MNENKFKLDYIKTNSIFLKKIDKKMNELKTDKKFMKKEIAKKILLFYDKFKFSLESSNYTVPLWQYNFFNTILETLSNNIEIAISEFNNNFLTLSLNNNKNNKRINLHNSLQKNSHASTPPLFNNNNTNINTIAIDILKRLLLEMGFSQFKVVFYRGYIILRGNNDEICFTILIDNDNIDSDNIDSYNIYIENLSKCTLRGSESLQIIDNLAKEIPNIKYISLVDLSDIKIFSSKNPINLAILKILTNGESWYNLFGYISSDDREKEHNKKIIDGYYENFVFNLSNEIKERGGQNSLELPKIIGICHELYPPLVSQSVRSYFNHIWTEIQKSKENSKNNWFAEYLNIIGSTNILRYNRSLTKYVR